MLAVVTVTLAPLAVKVPVAVALEPIVTLPNGSVVGETVSCPTEDTPVPETGIVNVGFVAVEVMVTFPLTAVEDVGVNDTVNVALFPPFNVSGVMIPLTLNPAPVIPTFETVTLDPPVFVIVSLKDPLLATLTLPKLRLVGLAASAPGAKPVADTGTVKVGFVAVDGTVRFPLTAPADVGANDTVNVALFPPFSVRGVVIPLKLNPAPVIPTLETVMLDPPVFVIVSLSDPLLPTLTFPKPRLVGLAANAPGVTPVADTGMVRVEFVAVELTVRLPVTAPAVVGANDTVNVALCPLLSVNGAAIPLTPRPVPVIPTCDTVTLETPVLVMVSESEP